MAAQDTDYSVCRHCRKQIRYSTVGAWVHRGTQSVFCDASATAKAKP